MAPRQFRRIRTALRTRRPVVGSGKIENLKRQLELPSPEMPTGVRKQELLALEQRARMMLADNHRWRPELNAVITVGSGQFTVAEAMYEIVRRALATLSN